MRKLAVVSLGNRALIALVTIFVLIFGVVTTAGLKQELIPSLQVPTAIVMTNYPGASPDVVEERVTQPIEQAVLGVQGLESSSSTSATGISTVVVNFEYGTNMAQAQQDLQAAVSRVSGFLPDEADSQVVTGSIDDLPVQVLSVTADLPPADLADRLTTIAVPELEKLPGVRAVAVAGGPSQRVLVDLDLDKVAQAGLTPAQISQALAAAGQLTSAGTITEERSELSVTLGAKLASADDVADIVLASPTSGSVVLGDIADVTLEEVPATSVSRTNGEASLTLSITKTPDGNTVDVSEAIAAALPHLEAEIGAKAAFVSTFDQAPFITQSIHDLLIEGGLGLVMAIVVILVFLLSIRSTLVTAVSIPVSVLIALIGLSVADYSLNILTLGALTIAIGRVVDDSIVVIENIKRHLSYGTAKLKAITTAVGEVAMAITAATITTVAVFLPIGVVGGQVGELFRPFAVTVALALLASLLVSLTIVPVLAYWFLKAPEDVVDPAQVQQQAEEKERRSWLQRAYVPALKAVVGRPVIALLVAAALLGGTLALIPQLRQDFLGDMGQDTISVTQEFEIGENLETQTEQALVVEDALRAVDGVDVVQTTIGGGGMFSFGMGGGSDQATFSVTTSPDADPAVVTEDIRAELDKLTDVGELTVASGAAMYGTDVVIDISAADPDVLREATEAVQDRMAALDHVTDVRSSLVAAQPRVEVKVDEEKAAELGLSGAAVAQSLQGLITPATVGSIERGGSTIDIVLRIDDAPVGLDALKKVEIAGAAGPVKLSEIASVSIIEVPPSISHVNGQRSASVTLTPTGNDLAQTSVSVQTALDEVDLPEGATASIGGVTADQAEAFGQLGLALLVAIAIVYVVMVATFKSLVQPLILLISIPFAATGVLVALLVSDTALGVPALIGLLMLIGIVVTNAIVLIDLVNHYRAQGQSIDDALINGARQRLRPILMTAAATIMALVPMGLGVTGGGVFISKPLAIVVIGGLFSSTILTLFLVPVLYRLVERSAEKRKVYSQQRRMARLEAKGLTLDPEGRVIHIDALPAGSELETEASAVAESTGERPDQQPVDSEPVDSEPVDSEPADEEYVPRRAR